MTEKEYSVTTVGLKTLEQAKAIRAMIRDRFGVISLINEYEIKEEEI